MGFVQVFLTIQNCINQDLLYMKTFSCLLKRRKSLKGSATARLPNNQAGSHKQPHLEGMHWEE